MKTARFTNVVNTCGEPEAHLLLTDPARDHAFQAALKANRVMTVFQAAHGNKADHGEIGYQPGQGRQFLIFPKSLRSFTDRTVVGIRYDLLEADEVEAEPPAPAAKTKKAAKPKPKARPKAKTKPKVKPKPPAKTKHAAKIIPFEPPADEDDTDPEVMKVKQQVRRAMKLLEDGKQVAAFNLLKQIAE